jgi:hypothetical protein
MFHIMISYEAFLNCYIRRDLAAAGAVSLARIEAEMNYDLYDMNIFSIY